MKRLLLILLAALPLTAQETADLATSLEILGVMETSRPGDLITFSASVQNNGPARATNVHFSAFLHNDPCTEQTIPALEPGERRTADCTMALPREEHVRASAFAFTIEQDDPDPENNRVDRGFTLVTGPDLYIESFPPRVVDAGLPFTVQIHYNNFTSTVATGVQVEILSPGMGVTGPAFCTGSGGMLRCNLGNVGQGLRSFDVVFSPPDRSAARLPYTLTISSREADLKPEGNRIERETRTYRTFFVRNTNDAGPDSLRQAMSSANAECGDGWPCKIAFRISNLLADWLTIRPETPLPVVTMSYVIDGAIQARYIGDSNLAGPEIEISGARLEQGHGFETICPVEILGLAVNGFPGDGFHYTAGPVCRGVAQFGPGGFDAPSIADNFIGTDPTGTTAIPNERGVYFERGRVTVRRNVIGGNRRSGVFVDAGEIFIARNTIGLDRTLSKDLGNGASGVYIGPSSIGTDVIDNYIGFNHHFGVAMARGAVLSSMRGNSFQANWGLGIDYLLDGPTNEVPDSTAPENPVRRPIITSARYDAATNTTIVEGSSETTSERNQVWVAVYANDEPDPSGYGEGQYYLGEVAAARDTGRFTFTYTGRAPGRWIAATSTRQNIIGLARTPGIDGLCGCGYTTQTSEFSRTVELE